MLIRMLATSAGFGMFWVRLPLAVTMIYHGYEKLRNVPGFIAGCDNLGIPPLFAYLAVIAEFFGGIGVLIAGAGWIVFPTGVGMNQPMTFQRPFRNSVPHGCGDEPVGYIAAGVVVWCSPRVWG